MTFTLSVALVGKQEQLYSFNSVLNNNLLGDDGEEELQVCHHFLVHELQGLE